MPKSTDGENPKKHNKDYYKTKKGLKVMGWTDSLISRFLDEPDLKRKNTVYKTASDICLYDVNRVKSVMESEEFVEAMKSSKVMKIRASKGVQTKINKTLDRIKEVPINVEIIPRDELLRRACKSYNKRNENREYFKGPVSPDKSQQLFLERIMVNYIRHNMSSYEHALDRIYATEGLVTGGRIAYMSVSEIVFANIEECYPYLAEECQRQMGHRADIFSIGQSQ